MTGKRHISALWLGLLCMQTGDWLFASQVHQVDRIFMTV